MGEKLMRLTREQAQWLVNARRGQRYTFNDAQSWREVGRPLKEIGFIRWVPNPRDTALNLTEAGAVARDQLKAQTPQDTPKQDGYNEKGPAQSASRGVGEA